MKYSLLKSRYSLLIPFDEDRIIVVLIARQHIDTNNSKFFVSPQVVKHAWYINLNIGYLFSFLWFFFSIFILSKVTNDCFHYRFRKLVLSVFCVFSNYIHARFFMTLTSYWPSSACNLLFLIEIVAFSAKSFINLIFE